MMETPQYDCGRTQTIGHLAEMCPRTDDGRDGMDELRKGGEKARNYTLHLKVEQRTIGPKTSANTSNITFMCRKQIGKKIKSKSCEQFKLRSLCDTISVKLQCKNTIQL